MSLPVQPAPSDGTTYVPALYDCPRGHVVTIAQCSTDWDTGASMHCGRPVTMRPADARRIDAQLSATTSAPVTHPHPEDGTHEGLARDCDVCAAEDRP